MPLFDVVVHHGGSGTTLGALASGVPQVVLPQGADQFANADALDAAGVAVRLLPEEVNADAVAERTHRLLPQHGNAEHRDAARVVAEEIAPHAVAGDGGRATTGVRRLGSVSAETRSSTQG